MKFLAFLLSGLLMFGPVKAAVTVDAFSGPSNIEFVLDTTRTVSLTTAGTSRALVLYLFSSPPPVTVKYNNVSMTLLSSTDIAGGVFGIVGVSNKASIYYLAAPTSGANDLIIDYGDIYTDAYFLVSFNGANQSTPASGFTYGEGTSAAPSISVASVSGDLVVDSILSANTSTVGAGQTLINSNAVGQFAGASRETAAGVSTTMSWTQTIGLYNLLGCNVKVASVGQSSGSLDDASKRSSWQGSSRWYVP